MAHVFMMTINGSVVYQEEIRLVKFEGGVVGLSGVCTIYLLGRYGK